MLSHATWGKKQKQKMWVVVWDFKLENFFDRLLVLIGYKFVEIYMIQFYLN